MNNEPTREEFAARLDAHESRIEARLAHFETDFTKFESRIMGVLSGFPTRAEIKSDRQWVTATAAGLALAVVAVVIGGIQWLDERGAAALGQAGPIVIQVPAMVAPPPSQQVSPPGGPETPPAAAPPSGQPPQP